MTFRAPARLLSIMAVLSCVALLSGCGSHPDNLSSAEREFIAQMIPHHELGMKLIDDATLHSYDVRLRRLVFEMSGYHGEELAQLHEMADHDHMSVADVFPGSLSAADLGALSTRPGPSHDTWWLHLMLIHHEGALQIASKALSSRVSDAIEVMAKNTTAVQTKEIADMRELLNELCTVDLNLPGC